MNKSDIQPGKFFVADRQGWIREVVSISDDGLVHWRSYEPQDGSPISNGGCSIEGFRRWALREANPDEVSNLQLAAAVEKEEQGAIDYFLGFLERIPDAFLLGEVRRRGLKVD